ncbi:acyl-CoA dehydrogenase family protein [Patulibacter brassicae]|jgi:alkylation response protein AidB-like acyl-CoA dehydrogenase|uniref:Acyl-CoA dehydrogenase family protein n=1 Tax=Patulibacter brassicae TaxID=1705717 RepID=A0ABU4VKE4_9ACTN|nr:acyl-CoA dehydrogenase family protein [Patulibacter brassicae]MDX8152307.1 acyl-CoA dehydrogenase family protein [Patulibacter brassicae]
MDLSLTDEQEYLREAAAGALGRVDTVAAAREALEDEGKRPQLWPTVVEQGWTGLLTSEERGGAGLGLYDAALIVQEGGKRLAPLGLATALPAAAILDAAGDADAALAAGGEQRVVWLPVAPPTDRDARWTSDARRGLVRPAAPSAAVSGDEVTLTGEIAWAPDAAQADRLLVVGVTDDDATAPVAAIVDASAAGVTVEPVVRYDATQPLAHVRLDGAVGRRVDADADALAAGFHVAQTLLAADAVGAVETLLEMGVAYAKERQTFGRPIGSYQAVKHHLVEVLRLLENARSLLIYAAWAHEHDHAQLALAASAARSGAGHALEVASRETISVHGGIGATWEHDAPLFFRRAQLTRRLLGGTDGATDRVAGELLSGVATV